MLTRISRLAASFVAMFVFSPAKGQTTPPLGQPATPPSGYTQFCRDNPVDCAPRSFTPTKILLNEESWRKIVLINSAVNTEVTPVTDQDHWGVPEHWGYPDDGKGDCEDYVLEKKRRLMRAGFPEQALAITVVRDHKGEGHAVLTVITDRGDFVLDNQVGRILAWQTTGYRYIKRQSEETRNAWISLGGIDTREMKTGE